jgi:hypothetical protein
MKSRILLLFGILLLVPTLQSIAQETNKADDLSVLQQSYQEQVTKIEDNCGTKVKALLPSYVKELESLEQSLAQKGNLDGVIVVRKEKELASISQQIPNNIIQTPVELKKVQEKFRDMRSGLDKAEKKEMATLTTDYVEKLELLKVSLTKSVKIDEAVMVKTEIERVKGGVDSNTTAPHPSSSEKATTPSKTTRTLPESLIKGRVLYYSFDKGKGEDVADKSGKHNNGKIFGKGKWVKDDKVGGAYEFDGRTSYISTPNNKNLNFQLGDFTYSFWVMPYTTRPSTQGLIGHAFNPEARLKNDKIEMIFHQGWKGVLLSSTSMSTNKFYFVTLTRQEGTGYVYVNGEMENSVAANFDCSSDKPMVLGRHSALEQDYFNGVIDEVMIWDRALSKKEVKDLFEATK